MQSTKVASRYAQSLMELTEEIGTSEKVLKNMEHMLSISKESRELQLFFSNPVIGASKKIDVFEKLFSDFEKESIGFIKLITKNKRENYLPQIAAAYIEKFKKSRGIIPISLSTATPMDAELKKSLLGSLESQVEGNFEVNENIDKSLLGGFVFRMGDTQIEASIARQLKELKQRLTN